MERNYYMIRMTNACEQEYENSFRKGFLSVGWSSIDLSGFVQAEDAVKAVYEKYYKDGNTAQQTVGRKLNEIRRFLEIKENDVIIVPYYSGIRIGFAEKKRYYDEQLKGKDMSNCIRISFLQTDNNEPLVISRRQLTEGLQRRLRVRGSTISDLYEFGEEIEQIINEKDYTSDDAFFRKEELNKSRFQEQLLKNIQNGHTHLQTGGLGLENLIKELLECDGYRARRCATTETKGAGDVDVVADKSSRFGVERVRIQIKHHAGISGGWGVEQLQAAKSYYNDPDCTYVWVTSAIPSEEAKKLAEDANVLVIDGVGLVEWITESIEKLSCETLRALGISQVPQII